MHFLVLGAFLCVNSFYLPGIAPKDYKHNDKIELRVNSLESPNTAIPYDFYDKRFHFCQPNEVKNEGESLGSVLMGDRIHNSVFDIQMGKEVQCAVLCTSTIPNEDIQFVKNAITQNYYINWEIDGLPVGTIATDSDKDEYYAMGFNLGRLVSIEGKTGQEMNTHFSLTIQYHTDNDIDFRIVGALITPLSIHQTSAEKYDCEETANVQLIENGPLNIVYTYSVKFEKSEKKWGTRWDNYLHVTKPKIHWFNLVNSIVIALFLTGMVAMILLRALHRDISRYNQVDQEDAQEEFGWKLVHGDVFRSPVRFQLLCVMLGNGAQVFCMAAITLVFGALGFLSPSNRGSLMTCMVVLYVCCGIIAGYVSARFYKMFGGEDWKRNVILSSFMVPGIFFLVFIILNFFLVAANSSGAVPFTTIFAMICMWFLVSIPLCFLGAFYGFRQPRIEQPVRTNQIPRQIPSLPNYVKPIPAILMGGILPFGAIFIELFFIMSSLWAHKVYYVFGFLFFVVVVLILTCAEVTILMCYFQLCQEDYRWWWRAYMTSGASAFYVFLYSIYYYMVRINIDFGPSTVLYFGWSFVMSFGFFLLTGFIGFLPCFWFVRKIYSSIKID